MAAWLHVCRQTAARTAGYKLPHKALSTLHVLTRAPGMVEAMAASGQLRQLTAQRLSIDACPVEAMMAVGLLAAVHPDLVAPGSELMAQLTRPGMQLRAVLQMKPQWADAGVLKADWDISSNCQRLLLVETAESATELMIVRVGKAEERRS